MDDRSKKTIFTGQELDKLKDFCKDCAEEDRKIHEQRQYNSDYAVPEPEEPKQDYHQPKKQSYQQNYSDYNQYEYNDSTNTHTHNIQYEDSVKTNVIGENDPDPHNARIKIDTFNQRLQQFGNNQ